MHSRPVGLPVDVWFLVGSFIYFHTSYVHGCAGLPETSLVAYMISTIISWAEHFKFFGILWQSHENVWVTVPPAATITSEEKLSHDMTKPTKWESTKQRLGSAWVSAQSDQSLLCTEWVAKDPSFLHVDSKDSDQTGQMPRLIWVFAGCTTILLVLSCRGSNLQLGVPFIDIDNAFLKEAIWMRTQILQKHLSRRMAKPTKCPVHPAKTQISLGSPDQSSLSARRQTGSSATHWAHSNLNQLPIWNSQNCSMFPLAFIAGWLQGHWWGFISRNYVVRSTFLLMNVFIALKGSHYWFLFDFTAAGVVPCGGRKMSPRTSTIVQFIFYFGPLRSAIIFWEIKISDWFRLIF